MQQTSLQVFPHVPCPWSFTGSGWSTEKHCKWNPKNSNSKHRLSNVTPITHGYTNHYLFRLTYFLQVTTNAFIHNADIQGRARKLSRFYQWCHRVRGKLSGFHNVKKENGGSQCSQVISWLDKCPLSWALLSACVWYTRGETEWQVLIFNDILLQKYSYFVKDPTGKSEAHWQDCHSDPLWQRRLKPHWPCL